MRPTRYEVVVLGELSHRFALAFDGMEVHAHEGRTAIRVWVVDQSQLHGLIDLIGELGLELVDLRVVEVEGGTTVAGSSSTDTTAWSRGVRP